MKKFLIFMLLFAVLLYNLSGVLAATNTCNLQASLVNQDPYPAVQGDTVKLLFQLTGVENSDCNGAVFKIDPGYAFTLTQNDSTKILSGSTYTQNYNNNWLIPYTLSVNNDAPDGDASIIAYYAPGSIPNIPTGFLSQTFNVSIQNSRADFEVYVENYDPTTKTITFQILNIAKVDVKAVTVTIPEQKNINLAGANTNIIGDLDSNSYTTADFLATPSTGNLTLDISYTDQANVRRTVEKNVAYDSQFFQGNSSSKGGSIPFWIILLIIIVAIVYWIYKRRKKKKMMLERRHNRS